MFYSPLNSVSKGNSKTQIKLNGKLLDAIENFNYLEAKKNDGGAGEETLRNFSSVRRINYSQPKCYMDKKTFWKYKK